MTLHYECHYNGQDSYHVDTAVETPSDILTGWYRLLPGGNGSRDAQGDHEAHGIGGGVDCNGGELPLCIWQEATQNGHDLTCPPF